LGGHGPGAGGGRGACGEGEEPAVWGRTRDRKTVEEPGTDGRRARGRPGCFLVVRRLRCVCTHADTLGLLSRKLSKALRGGGKARRRERGIKKGAFGALWGGLRSGSRTEGSLGFLRERTRARRHRLRDACPGGDGSTGSNTRVCLRGVSRHEEGTGRAAAGSGRHPGLVRRGSPVRAQAVARAPSQPVQVARRERGRTGRSRRRRWGRAAVDPNCNPA
jgi:hypothetical protein